MTNEQIAHYQRKLAYEMDSADVFQALEQQAAAVVVVDTRKKFAYDLAHIPGALSLPHLEMNEASTQQLDRNKT